MDKLRRFLSGNDSQDDEESGIMTQVNTFLSIIVKMKLIFVLFLFRFMIQVHSVGPRV